MYIFLQVGIAFKMLLYHRFSGLVEKLDSNVYVGHRVGPLSSQETHVQGPWDWELTSVNGLHGDTLLMIPFTI